MSDIRRTLLFLQKDDDILLAMKKRGFGVNLWNGVGGKIEPDETIEQALIRETQEEISVTPIKYHQVAELDFYGGSDIEGWRMYCYVYFSNSWIGTPTESEEMIPEWFKTSDIPYDKMWQDDKYWLPKVLIGKLITGKFYFDKDDNITSHNITEVRNFTNNDK